MPNSLDASGGSASRNLLDGAERALIRAAASTQPLGPLPSELKGDEMRTIGTLLTLSLHVILVITGTECVRAQAPAPAPTLLTEENSARAIALDSVTLGPRPSPGRGP